MSTSISQRILVGGAATAAIVVALAGCGAAPTSGDTAATSDFLPCILSDQGGFDDRSFNQLGYEGVQEAADALGADFKSVVSKTPNDYESNIAALVTQNCDVIVASGFALVAPVEAAAAKYPDTEFVMVDDASIVADNVKPVVFNTNEAAFLGGYAAASYSSTGVVATFGGEEFPSVTIYMDGFADGVAYYNEQNDATVQLLGWDAAAQKGTFVGSFTDQNASKTITSNFLDNNADVIVPVAGSLYQGAGAAIESSDSDAVLLGVDADVYESDTSGLQSILLASILKNVKPTVATVVKDAAAKGGFSNEPYIGTLDNDGVGLSSFHDFEDAITPDLLAELDAIRAGIVDGSIQVTSPAAF